MSHWNMKDVHIVPYKVMVSIIGFNDASAVKYGTIDVIMLKEIVVS